MTDKALDATIVCGLLVLAALLWFSWWQLPTKLSTKYRPFDEERGRAAVIEDSFRKAIAQAIGGLALISALFFTALQYRLGAQTYGLAIESQQRDQYQKAFDALKGDDVATHVGGVFGLQILMRESPEWRVPILSALSAAAVTFSRPNGKTPDRITPDANAALQGVAWALSKEELSKGQPRIVTHGALNAPQQSSVTASTETEAASVSAESASAALAAESVASKYQLARGFFAGVDLHAALLNDANMEGANFSGSDFFEAHLGQANLAFATLNGASFVKAHMEGARFVEAHLDPGPNFAVASLQTGRYIGTQLNDAHLDKANMTGAWLTHANLQAATLTFAMMGNSHLEYACMDLHTIVRGADLTNATLNFGWLAGADFGRAAADKPTTLTRARFRHSNLASTKFTGATLDGADFRGANLEGTDFTGASMQNVLFEGARFCGTTLPDGTKHSDSAECAKPWPDMPVGVVSCANQMRPYPYGPPYMVLTLSHNPWAAVAGRARAPRLARTNPGK